MNKKVTNLRLKITLILCGIGIVCSTVFGMMVYIRYHDCAVASLQGTLKNTGCLIESQMPVLGDVDFIRREGIAESEAYMDILRELQKYNDAFGFIFIYLIENGTDGFTFLLDTDKVGKNTDSTFLKAASDEVLTYLRDAVENRRAELSDIYTSKYGTFMSVFVPVVRQGKVVSVIGLDYDASFVRSLERRVLLHVVICFAATIAFVLIIAIVFSRAVVALVKETDELNKLLLSKNERLAVLSTTDDLTKLNNKRSFMEYMDIVWKQNHRLKLPITVLMIDVDYFKKYNDALGHLEGDKALFAVAQCIKGHAKRETDFVARFGGEEFVCVLPFIERNEAIKFANALVAKVENMKIPHPESEHSKYLTVSIGMADVVPDDTYSCTRLLSEADKALYMAKRSGRNMLVVG